ncbi:Sas10 C-terminal domain-containing protein [Rhizoctonia solani]|nr:Sas10 C-terminal domain-containing protein [Rhizoctonia solani]
MGRHQTRTNSRAGHNGNRGRSGGRKSNGTRADNRTSIKESGRMKRWETAEDIPMDEEDEFFAARDKILLDGTARARARAGPAPDDDDEFDEDDEVFGLDGVGESSEEDYDDDGMEEDQDNTPEPRSKTKAKPKKQPAAQLEDSDASTDSEVELSRWGKSRSVYYADNSRVMDEDDEEARKMEEREARRLQLKMITEIGENDWGYNDVHDIEVAISQSAVPAVPELPVDKASLMRHMEKYDPLSLALAREWEDIAYQVVETSAAVKQVEEESPDDPALGLMHLHHQTLLSYATTLAFYLHLQSTPTNNDLSPNSSETPSLTPKEAKRLRTEAIGRLLTLKQSLSTLEDLGFAADEEDDFDESDEDILTDEGEGGEGEERSEEDVSPYGLKPGEKVSLASGGAPRLQNLEEPWQQDKISGWMDSASPSEPKTQKKKKKKSSSDLGPLEEGELEALMQDALDLAPPTETSPPKKRKKIASETSETSKKKKGDIPKPVFDLVEPEFTVTKSKAKQDSTLGVDVDLEALGDPTQLSHTDASDKAGRRKSLRFHTSKIESTSNRRSTARSGMGGDDDLPYRERRKEQNRRGLGEGGDDLEMGEGGDGDIDPASIGKRNRAASEPLGDEGSEGEDGYYELVRTTKKQKKEEQKAEYEAMRAAERVDPDEDSSEGPRSLTRAILKNRGMNANRSPKNKAARNPRVKKKMQYVKAQKKLSSRQAVFKGGAEVAAAREGRYEGEKSGISGRVVKSIKL